jgi:riboflavin synthase
MFTGIISHTGIFRGYRQGKREMAVESPEIIPRLKTGESLAVNGVCLTLVRGEQNMLFFNLSRETVERTTLGSLRQGRALNLELPLALSSGLSGHLVTGHIDGKGRVVLLQEKPPGRSLRLSYPAGLKHFFVPKGSVAVDGVSLTIAALGQGFIEVELIPLTLKNSTIGLLKRGEEVNLECDIIGKYVYNYLRNKDVIGRNSG